MFNRPRRASSALLVDEPPATHNNATCAIASCANKQHRAGYCAKHYGDKEQQNATRVADAVPTGRWWEKRASTAAEATVWQQLTTKEGLDYYYNTETQATSWDKPEELMTDAELNSRGSWYWIPDPENVFVPGVIKSRGGGRVVAVFDDGTERTVNEADVHPLKRSSLQRVVSDLVLLDEMTPALILHNLRERFKKNKIYTNVGTILISVNPYKMLPLYTPEVIYKYKSRKLGAELPPHVYNIAHDCHTGLMDFATNQSVIISGESGAGKTEATKQCLSYLAALAGSVNGVEKKVLQGWYCLPACLRKSAPCDDIIVCCPCVCAHNLTIILQRVSSHTQIQRIRFSRHSATQRRCAMITAVDSASIWRCSSPTKAASTDRRRRTTCWRRFVWCSRHRAVGTLHSSHCDFSFCPAHHCCVLTTNSNSQSIINMQLRPFNRAQLPRVLQPHQGRFERAAQALLAGAAGRV
jgi:hypothetical protein